MPAPRSRVFRILFYTFLFFLAMSWPLARWGGWPLYRSFVLGYLCSVLNIAFSLVSIRWGFRRRVKVFYAVVLGGMAFRLLLFGLMVLVLLRWLHWPLYGFLISFIVFYLFLQYHEIKWINDELRSMKSGRV